MTHTRLLERYSEVSYSLKDCYLEQIELIEVDKNRTAPVQIYKDHDNLIADIESKLNELENDPWWIR